MSPADLIRELRGAGEPLHMAAAEALTAALAQEDRLRARLKLIEGVARLNGDTIRSMQRARAVAEAAPLRR
jgi:hypothetical protein